MVISNPTVSTTTGWPVGFWWSELTQDMIRVHTHASGEGGIFANAYAIETDEGVVAIDATLTVSESGAFRRTIDAIGKPLLAVLLTHAHPDHVAGIGGSSAGATSPSSRSPRSPT